MTNKEAKEIIESECYVFNPLNLDRTTKINTALDMAIKALEQKPCEDAISREAVKELFQEGSVMGMYHFLGIDELPSVTPKKDEWIPCNERLPEERIAVLVWCPERKNIHCACYEEKQWWIFGAYFKKIEEDVTAWQPLPEPYEEK